MKAFVTGGTGLLGNNLVRMLLEQGHEVKALARSPKKAARLFGDLPVTVVQGDMQDVPALRPNLLDAMCYSTRRRISANTTSLATIGRRLRQSMSLARCNS